MIGQVAQVLENNRVVEAGKFQLEQVAVEQQLKWPDLAVDDLEANRIQSDQKYQYHGK